MKKSRIAQLYLEGTEIFLSENLKGWVINDNSKYNTQQQWDLEQSFRCLLNILLSVGFTGPIT